MTQAEHLQPRDQATQTAIELGVWFTAFEASLHQVDESYVCSILPATDKKLGVRVAKIIMDEWKTSDDGQKDFKELASIPAAALISIYGTEALRAFMSAVNALQTGGPDIDNYVPPRPSNPDPYYWTVEEMVDHMTEPETEEQALDSSTQDYLWSKANESLLLQTKDPRRLIEEYTTQRIAEWKKSEEEAEIDDPDEVFIYQAAQKALTLTRDRFTSIYDIAERIEGNPV